MGSSLFVTVTTLDAISPSQQIISAVLFQQSAMPFSSCVWLSFRLGGLDILSILNTDYKFILYRQSLMWLRLCVTRIKRMAAVLALTVVKKKSIPEIKRFWISRLSVERGNTILPNNSRGYLWYSVIHKLMKNNQQSALNSKPSATFYSKWA